jgi:hypothetical protein
VNVKNPRQGQAAQPRANDGDWAIHSISLRIVSGSLLGLLLGFIGLLFSIISVGIPRSNAEPMSNL